MRVILFLGFYCCLVLLIGCQSVADDPEVSGQGILSFYTGEIDNGSAMQKQVLQFPWPIPNTVNEGYVYLKKIEITTTGLEWVTLVNEEVAIPMHFKYQGELIRAPIEEITVSEGEYHGLRISLEPKIRILDIGNLGPLDTLLAQEPVAIYVRMGMSQLRSSVDTLEFTSANGYLIPFTVNADSETRIILHFIAQADGNETTQTLTRWWTDVEARATKFIY